jgi:hypothetical protein
MNKPVADKAGAHVGEDAYVLRVRAYLDGKKPFPMF